jgi:hypothetical protein
MSKEELKELIQEVYDDFDFADFNLHFVNEVEAHKVYEIRNNRILNKLKDTTLVAVNSMVSNKEIETLSLYGVDVKNHLIISMIEETANKILTDIYKFNKREWFYGQREPVNVEMTITNWELQEEKTETGIVYKLRFEVA